MVASVRHSGFVRNVIVLAGGAAGAQAINAITAPFLTRLFVPSEIGQLGLFLSFMTIATIALSLRYEQAIVLPATAAGAARLLLLALGLVPLMSLVAAAILGGLIGLDGAGYGTLDPVAIPIAFVGLTGFGLTAVLRFWQIRHGAFRAVSEIQLAQSATRSVGQIVAGLAGFGVVGLFVADAIARMIGIVRLAGAAAATARPAWASPGPSIGGVARRYWRFPVFGVPSSLINSAGLVLPVPLLAATYGLEVAGFMALVQRVLAIPLNVVGASVGDALLVRLSEQARSDPAAAMPFFRRTAAALAGIGIPLAVVLALVGPELFALVFGAAWRDAGTVAAIVSPWLVAALIVSPLSRVTLVYQGQAQKLIYDVLTLTAVVAGYLGGHAAGLGAFQAIALVTALQVGAYAVYFVILVRTVRAGRFGDQEARDATT